MCEALGINTNTRRFVPFDNKNKYMGLTYGLEVIEETLRRLSADRNIDNRLRNAWSEIDVITEDDINTEDYEEIVKWKLRYTYKSDFVINESEKAG